MSQSQPARLHIQNTGHDRLLLRELAIESDPPGVFSLESEPFPAPSSPVRNWPDDPPHAFTIAYHGDAFLDGPSPTATVTLTTNPLVYGTDTTRFHVVLQRPAPHLQVLKPVVDFGALDADQTSVNRLSLLSIGSLELIVSGFTLSGHPGFSMEIDGTNYAVSDESGAAGVTSTTPIVVQPGTAKQLQVSFRATDSAPAEATIVFMSNDPLMPSGTTVRLFANRREP